MPPTKVEGSPPVVMDDDLMDAHFLGGYSKPPDVRFIVTKRFERKEVMDEMQPLLLRLRGKWTDALAEDIAATLTVEKFQVMEPGAKGLLSGWMYQQEDRKYILWLKRAEADLTTIAVGEHLTIPGEEYWSSTRIMRSVLEEMDEAMESVERSEDKDLLEKSLSMLKMFVECVDWHTRHQEDFPRLDPGTLKLLMSDRCGRCTSPLSE
ncbi:hypothetical protein Trihar35433_957 [Trichoderma harzianum]|nr:hypothetical protein Trihar35433_957 [Trichoderma harzianum]